MAEMIGVLLAAGFGTRFGGNKLLAEIQSQPMIAYGIAALAPCKRVIAVVQENDRQLQAFLNGRGIDCVHNPEPQRGMGYSIACAVQATPQGEGWCILPADMPCVTEATTRKVIDALYAGALLAAPSCQGQRGHPVGFSRQYYAQLASLEGDTGARSVLEKNARQLTLIETDDAGILLDIDDPVDLSASVLHCLSQQFAQLGQ